MVFAFQGLSRASLFLAIIYLVVVIYTYGKLKLLQSNSTNGLNTRKLFVIYLLIVALLRFMSFSSMVVLDFENVEYSNIHSTFNNSYDQEGVDFFEKASLVLFDFPDFCCVSAYVLLMVIWADSYFMSRRHWLSSYKFRRVWMLGYFLFNIVLYSIQVSLYTLLFMPSIGQVSINIVINKYYYFLK